MAMKFLIPLDGSKIGESAIPCVEGLIEKLKHDIHPKVILLHVIKKEYLDVQDYDGDVHTPRTEETLKNFTARAMEYLIKVGDRFAAKKTEVALKVEVGEAATEIVRCAEFEKVDMIAMSTHGRSGIGRWAVGSVTDKVLRLETHIPIIVVRGVGK